MKRLTSFFMAGALMLATSSAALAAPVKYAVDIPGMHAAINFKIQHLGYSWLTGRFDTFNGQFVYDKDNLANSSVEIEIKTASVNSNHAERDKHLRDKEFLNVKKFPKAIFKSTSISGTDKDMKITGDLTLNGVTKSIVIKAHKLGEGKDPWGGYRAGFSGSTTIKMADFNITKNLGPASTHVQLDLEVEGIRQK